MIRRAGRRFALLAAAAALASPLVLAAPAQAASPCTIETQSVYSGGYWHATPFLSCNNYPMPSVTVDYAMFKDGVWKTDGFWGGVRPTAEPGCRR